MYLASPGFVNTSSRDRLSSRDNSSFYDRLCRQNSASSVYSRSSSFDNSSSNLRNRYTTPNTSSLTRPLPVGPREYYGASKPPLPPTGVRRTYPESYGAFKYGPRSASVDRHDSQVHQLTHKFENLTRDDIYNSPSLSHRTIPYRPTYTSLEDEESRDSISSLPRSTTGLYRSKVAAASMPDVPSYVAQNDSVNSTRFSRGDTIRSSSSSADSSSSSGVHSGGSSFSKKDLYSRSTSPSSLSNDWSSAKSSSESESLSPSSRSGLLGLQNLGNTCFMNSILQCLSHTKPLRTFCLKNCSASDINNNTSRMKGALMKSFCELLSQLWSESRPPYVSPDHFKSQIQKFAPRFVGYSQQDAQELLRYVLWGLHEDVNRVRTKPSPLPLVDDNLGDSQKASESWKRYLRIDNSRIVDVFVGQLKSELCCSYCHNVSTTFDPFWDLSLPIPSDRRGQVTLQDCLDAFTREEVLDGDEKPKCEKCNTHRKCTKKMSIYKFPTILVLHLKRFSGDKYRSRLSTLVSFPTKGLDLSKFSANYMASSNLYNLYGISNHSGTPLMGHYTAYVCHAIGSKWHYYDDTRVSSISEKSVITSEAYVLFYESANNIIESSRL